MVSDGFCTRTQSEWCLRPEPLSVRMVSVPGATSKGIGIDGIVALRCCTLGTSCFKLNRQLYQLRPVDKYVDTYCARLDVCWCFTCDSRLGSKFAQVLWQVLPWLTQEVERWPVLSAQCCNLGRFLKRTVKKCSLQICSCTMLHHVVPFSRVAVPLEQYYSRSRHHLHATQG